VNGHVKFVVNKMRERSAGRELQLEVADFGDSESRPVAHTMTRPRLQRKRSCRRPRPSSGPESPPACAADGSDLILGPLPVSRVMMSLGVATRSGLKKEKRAPMTDDEGSDPVANSEPLACAQFSTVVSEVSALYKC
jgi:hypothetical protein